MSSTASSPKPKGLFVLSPSSYDFIYGPNERTEINRLVDIYAPPQSMDTLAVNPSILAEAELIFSGWGMAPMDEAFLQSAPRLKAVFYGAGSIKGIVSDAFWNRNILITSAYAGNAVPVTEFAMAQILLSLKRVWYYVMLAKQTASYPTRLHVPGAYGSTVGLISLGMIGRRLAKMLQAFDLHVLACDPFCKPEEAAALNVELCSLEDIFHRSNVVSLHTPWLKETEGMITGAHLASMLPDATFINTARGAVVNEAEMVQVLIQRPDLYAILDVTYPEPPLPGSPLYTLPNVILTPHIAGSMDRECLRMGQIMAAELKRYLSGEPLQWAISQEKSFVLA